MEVWVVFRSAIYPGESGRVVAVCSTGDKAKEIVDTNRDYDAEPYIVDAGEET